MHKHYLTIVRLVVVSIISSNLDAQENQTTNEGVRVVEPETRVDRAQRAAIDDERFQLGFFTGTLSVEDFGTEVVAGFELTYHLQADWLLQAGAGTADIDRAAFETPQASFLANKDRKFRYLNMGGGYRWFRGRSFLGSSAKYDSDIYVLFGAERVSFAANDEWGINVGLSYRVVLRDWLTMNIDMREHVFKREFIGDDKQTFNTEFKIGVNSLF